jgi:hypothetical protein
MPSRISEATLKRIRDYAVEEPSYTVAFMAWELGMSPTAIASANKELLRLGIVHQIEERKGPYAAVFAYRPVPGDTHSPRRRVDRTSKPAPRAVAVPLTGKPKGHSGKPGENKRKQAKGHRVRKPRNGT